MKRICRKLFKCKKPSLGSIHGHGPAISTSTITGNPDLMPFNPQAACDSDGTASAQVTAASGVSVRV